jgi:hypothetical protein
MGLCRESRAVAQGLGIVSASRLFHVVPQTTLRGGSSSVASGASVLAFTHDSAPE